MVENYEDIMKEWSAPKLNHGCCNTVTINPADELDRWAVQQTITLLANSDYYYTKAEVDNLLKKITQDAVTKEEVEIMIAVAIEDKANQSDLEALSAQVATNTERILNTYTKPEVNALLASYYNKIQTNSLFANYSKVEGTTLHLNADNIG